MSEHNAPDFDLQCPDWCYSQHGDGLHPDDERHESEVITVPAVALALVTPPHGGGPQRRSVGAEIFLALHRQSRDPETWVSLGLNGRGVDLSLESTHRMHLALGDLLNLTKQERG